MSVPTRQPETPARQIPPALPAALEQSDDEIDLQAWAARAAPGDVIEYHRGHLAQDRNRSPSGLSRAACIHLDRTANVALAMEAAGQVLLVQRRHGDGDYSYLAVIASQQKQTARPMSRPIAIIPQVRSDAMPIPAEDLA